MWGRAGGRARAAQLVAVTMFATSAIAVAVAATHSASVAAVDGLVAAYGFGEGAGSVVLDASGSGLTGTVSGATWTPAGRNGGALSFDGVDDVVAVPDAAALDLTTGMTLEAWVNPTALSGWRTVLLKERASGLSYSLYASNGSGAPNTFLAINGSDRGVVAPAAVATGAWTHLAATYDGSTSRLFVNGTQVASLAVAGSIATSGNQLKIGGNAVWGEWFAGSIDDVRIYNRPLTAAEIQSDMGVAVGPGTPAPPPPGADTIGRWTGPVELGMVAVNMILLPTGKVLMYRGENAGGTSASVFDPATSTQKAVPAPYNIFCSGHAQLADGRVLVVGGHDNAAGILGSAQAAIFDPVSETWTSVPSMSQRRWYPTATTLPDGRVLVTSGAKTSFTDIADVPEIYDPATNSWTQLTAARRSFWYYPFSFVLPDGKVLIAGSGEQAMNTLVLDVAQQQWTVLDPAVLDAGSAAMYGPGKVLKTGTAATTDINNVPTSAATYVLDTTAASPRWRATAPMARPRAYHTLTPLPDGTVVVTGGGVTTEGKAVSAAVYEAEVWSPTTETWSTMASMSVPRLYHGTALLLPDARVMVAGSGDSYGGPNQTTAEFFEPPYLFKGARPTVGGVPALVAHGATFGATVTGTISRVSLERLGAVTHQFDENARHVDLAFQQSGGQLTITAPANANVAPPGYYLLYAVSDQGVPSVGRFIRLPAAGADTVRPTAPTGLATTTSIGRADLTWTASTDNVGVTGYDVHRSVTAGFTPSAATKIGSTTTATSYVDLSVAAGTYWYRVVARDAAGNTSDPSSESTATVPADTTPPTVSVTAPASGTTVSGSVTLTASAGDNVGVASVRFRVDGSDVGTLDTSAPYSTTWASGTAANGGHVVTAVATDTAGNQTTSTAVNVTVDNLAPPPASGLVGAWSFDQGNGAQAPDSSSQRNDGAVSGAAWSTDGRFGGALTFDGVNDRVDVPDAASLDLTNGMTLEAWLRPTSTSGWRTAVLKERTSGLSYALYASDGTRPAAQINVGGGDVGPTGTTGLPTATWTHLATTFDGATQRIFVNGTQVGTRSTTGSITTSTGALRIGGNAVWGEWFAGMIDEVRVYNRALSAAEIQADMTTPIGAPRPADTTAPSAPASLSAVGSLGRVDLSWPAATDDVGVVAYEVHRSTTPVITPGSQNLVGETPSTSFADVGLPAGTYYYVVRARDAAGNVGSASPVDDAVVTADTTAPTVSITQPTGGSTVAGTVTVVATAQDAVGVAGVQFRVDGVNLGSEDTTAPYQVSWLTTTTSNGAHVVDAVARDAAGNTAVAAPQSVTVSNSAPPPVSGLVGAWSFDAATGSIAADSSTRGNNGTISGATWTSAGRTGGALTFDGVNDSVGVPDAASLDLTTGMTMEAWVRPSSTSGWRTVLMKERTGGLSYALYSSNNQARPELDVRISTDRTTAGPTALPVNQWSHVAATYDGTTLRLYVNGVLASSRAQTGSMSVSASPLRIGGNAIWSEWFAGAIDEVRLYDRALTAMEIQADMATPVA